MNRLPAKRSLGQNFLIDSNIAGKIVHCLDPGSQEKILEIGPGVGALTSRIIQYNPHPVLLEKDIALAMDLKSRMPACNIIASDALRFDWVRLNTGLPWKLIGNLPYNVASPLIWMLVRDLWNCSKMVFTIQKEVAQRITSLPGKKLYGGLSAWVQNFAKVKLEFSMSPHVFRPRPKVHSAVISLRPLPRSLRPTNHQALASLLSLCFQKRRKQLSTILRGRIDVNLQEWLQEQGLSNQARPEQLSAQQFYALSKYLKIKD